MKRADFARHRFKNLLHTGLLLLAMAAISALLGWFIAGVAGVVVALLLGISSSWLTPRMSPRLMLRLYGATRLSRAEAPTLYRIVEALAERADLPDPPEVYYIPSPMMNAVTVGEGEEAAVGVTDGLIRGLHSEELVGVVAHEIAHLANGDTRVMNLADYMGRMTSLMSSFGKILVLVNLPLLLTGSVTISWALVLTLLLAPVGSGLLQLALSRTREFDADLDAVRLTGDPEGLASGLKRLEKHNKSFLKHLLWPGYGQRQPSILRTHPHTEERIERLRDVTQPRDLLESQELDPLEVSEQRQRVRGRPRWRPLGLWY